MWSVGLAGGLVVAVRVEGEFAEDLAGGGVDDADFQAVDEQQDVGSCVGSSDADVVESAVVSQGHHACFVDAVGAHPVVDLSGDEGAGGGFGSGRVGGVRGRAVRQRSVGPVLVVVLAEGVDQGLQLGDGRGLVWLGGEPFLEGLLEAFDFAAGGGGGPAWSSSG